MDSASLVARARRRPERARQARYAGPKAGEQHLRDFRTDIQGLRAVAILTVVLFHAGVPGIGDGFIGVDIFFVISGFLITGMLWREMSSTGTVRLGRFYGARARRLLPAGCVVLIATAIASALLLTPLDARYALKDGIASALYIGNYRFAVEAPTISPPALPLRPFSTTGPWV